jgi:hypothetical protein
MDYIIGIDPGSKESAFCLVSAHSLAPVYFVKEDNEKLLQDVINTAQAVGLDNCEIVIERVASYGKAVGADVFATCEWIGEFRRAFKNIGIELKHIYRMDEKKTLCHNPRAGDSIIRQALIDRFAYGVPNKGKGTKKDPGWFYGFRLDVWMAYAVAVTYADMKGG